MTHPEFKSAREIRAELSSAERELGQIIEEARTLDDGPLSRSDIQALNADGWAEQFTALDQALADELTSKPQRHYFRGEAEFEAALSKWKPRVMAREFDHAKLFWNTVGRSSVRGGLENPVVHFWLPATPGGFVAKVAEALKKLPKSAFGESYTDRTQRGQKLSARADMLEARISHLRAAWAGEVGDGIPLSAPGVNGRPLDDLATEVRELRERWASG